MCVSYGYCMCSFLVLEMHRASYILAKSFATKPHSSSSDVKFKYV